MKKPLACLGLALALLLPAAHAQAQTAEKPKTVRITYVTAPFNVPSIVMREKGFLDEAFAAKG